VPDLELLYTFLPHRITTWATVVRWDILEDI
jgi:hypothetical protein